MPIQFDEQEGVMRVRFHGAVSGEELHALVTAMEQAVAGRSIWPDNLLDLRRIELSGLGLTDLMSLGKRRESVNPPHAIRTAILADSPTIMGFARMFQSLNHNPNITIQVFGDPAEAETWLLSQPRES